MPPQPCFWETVMLCAEMERTRQGTEGVVVDFAKFEGVLPLAHTELSGECGTHTRVLSLRWTCGCYQFVDGTWSQRLDEKNQRRDQVVTEEGPALCPKQVEMGGGRVRPSTWPSGELKVCSAVAIGGPYYPFPQCLSTDKGRNFHVLFLFFFIIALRRQVEMIHLLFNQRFGIAGGWLLVRRTSLVKINVLLCFLEGPVD